MQTICRTRPLTRAFAALAVAAALQACHTEPARTGAVRSPTDNIGALGRIQPRDGVIRLAARSLGGQASIVSKLLVREGDTVKSGQIVAELDSTAQLEAAWRLSEARVAVARGELDRARAGVRAQQAEVDRLELQLAEARKDLSRYEALQKSNSVAESAVDKARTNAESVAKMLVQAQERLSGKSGSQPLDVRVAESQLDAAVRDAARTRAEYEASQIRSPLAGRVIKVHAWPGAQVGPEGVMELAETDPMYVLAEVAETDMTRVHPGQHATVSADGLTEALTGKVESVGLAVRSGSVLKLDPAEFSDARVVETKIRLDDGARAVNLINLRVRVVIEPSAAAQQPRSAS